MNYEILTKDDRQLDVIRTSLQFYQLCYSGNFSEVAEMLISAGALKETPDEARVSSCGINLDDRKQLLRNEFAEIEQFVQNSEASERIVDTNGLLQHLESIRSDQCFTLAQKEVGNISFACEVFARACMGQLDMVADIYLTDDILFELRERLGKCEICVSGLHKNAFWGITSEHLVEQARTAWDITEVFRHRLSWDRNPEGGWGVNFDKPMGWSKLGIPLIETRKID